MMATELPFLWLCRHHSPPVALSRSGTLESPAAPSPALRAERWKDAASESSEEASLLSGSEESQERRPKSTRDTYL
jgi:hypothetical protein